MQLAGPLAGSARGLFGKRRAIKWYRYGTFEAHERPDKNQIL